MRANDESAPCTPFSEPSTGAWPHGSELPESVLIGGRVFARDAGGVECNDTVAHYVDIDADSCWELRVTRERRFEVGYRRCPRRPPAFREGGVVAGAMIVAAVAHFVAALVSRVFSLLTAEVRRCIEHRRSMRRSPRVS